jgi:hypothetical protein
MKESLCRLSLGAVLFHMWIQRNNLKRKLYLLILIFHHFYNYILKFFKILKSANLVYQSFNIFFFIISVKS